MTLRPKARLRLLMTGLAVAGTVSGASAQYYGGYYDEDYEPYAPRYYERYAPVPPAPIPPRTVSRAALRDYGLAQIDRTVRTASSYIIDGRTTQGRRTRLIIDRYSGELVDRIALPELQRDAPRIARTDPRELQHPGPKPIPKPPERPESLKPPAQASAPATLPAPAPAPAPALPNPVPPAPATAPAQAAPPATANLPASEPTAPESAPSAPSGEQTKPRLVNPSDVRGIDAGNDRQPPLAAASRPAAPAAPAAAPIEFPPFKVDDVDATKPATASPAIPPVAPLE